MANKVNYTVVDFAAIAADTLDFIAEESEWNHGELANEGIAIDENGIPYGYKIDWEWEDVDSQPGCFVVAEGIEMFDLCEADIIAMLFEFTGATV